MADITAEFVQKIIDLAPIEQLEIDGREYADKKLNPIIPPVAEPIGVNTLTGLRDYLEQNPDTLELSNLIIHVKNQCSVAIRSSLAAEWKQRNYYLLAEHTPKGFQFGTYLPIENFIIAMQTYFVQDEQTAAIIKLCGNLKQETGVTYTDDGISQEVQAKAGIARIENVALPNPVKLAPFRTFLEVEQPASNFVFRLKKTDAGPVATLFEADGGGWTLEAIKRVRDWLRTSIPAEVTILA